MHINDSILLNYIKEEASFLLENAKKYSYSEFSINPVLKRAFARSIEIIGEASKKLSKEFKTNNSEMNWRAIAGMRDKLIHEYFGIDYVIVWDVANNKSIELLRFIQSIDSKFIAPETLFDSDK